MLMDIVDNAGPEKDRQEEPWRWTGVTCVEEIITVIASRVVVVSEVVAELAFRM